MPLISLVIKGSGEYNAGMKWAFLLLWFLSVFGPWATRGGLCNRAALLFQEMGHRLILSHDPLKAEYDIGLSRIIRGDYRGALKQFDKVLRYIEGPGDVDFDMFSLLYRKGWAHFHLGEDALAQKFLVRATHLAPTETRLKERAEVYHLLGTLSIKENLERALSYFDMAVRLNPEPSYLVSRAVVYRKLGLEEKAQEDLEVANGLLDIDGLEIAFRDITPLH